jgi:hypothetical protein
MLTHLEFEQFKRALNHLRSEKESSYERGPVKREDVLEVLLPYVEGFKPPNPHPEPKAETPA